MRANLLKGIALLLAAIAGFSVANLDIGRLGETDFSLWGPDAWEALAAGITALIAAIAAWVALYQLGEARKLRLEQAQPYVVAYMETDGRDPQLVYISVKNFGLTAASDVAVRIAPIPERSPKLGGGDVWLPDKIPLLAPGQTWRTLWDFSPARADTDLPDHHVAAITFSDSRNEQHVSSATLDWSAHVGRRWVARRDVHDVAEALRDMAKTTGKWSEGIHGGLAVFTRDGDSKDEREREEIRAWRAERAAEQECAAAPQETENGT